MTYIGSAVLDGTTRAVPSEGSSAGVTGEFGASNAAAAGKASGAADSYSPAASQPAVEMSPVFTPGVTAEPAASLAAEWTQQVQRRAAGAYRSASLLR